MLLHAALRGEKGVAAANETFNLHMHKIA